MGSQSGHCCDYTKDSDTRDILSQISHRSKRKFSQKSQNGIPNNITTNKCVTTNQNAGYVESGKKVIDSILGPKKETKLEKAPSDKADKKQPDQASQRDENSANEEAKEVDKNQRPAVQSTLVAPEVKGQKCNSQMQKSEGRIGDLSNISRKDKINRSEIKKTEKSSKALLKTPGQMKKKRSEVSQENLLQSSVGHSTKKKRHSVMIENQIRGFSKIKNSSLSKVNEEENNKEEDKQFDGVGFDDGFGQEEQEYDKYSAKLVIMYEKYSFKEFLGVGVYSEVRRIVNNFTQESFAVKILKKDYLKKEKEPLKPILDQLLSNEHKNVTKVVEYFQDKKYYYLIYEHNQGGMMFDYICESAHYDKKMIANIIKQILSALLYNQGQGKEIYHREIRPENLMVEDALLDIISLKINDFSTSQEYNPKFGKNKQMKQTFSCIYFTPPEVIAKLGYHSNSDIWSTGILLYLLLIGKNPVKDFSNKIVIKNIKSKNFKIDNLVGNGIIEEEEGDLLKRMLERNVKKRISIIEAMNHPWILKYCKEEVEDASVSEQVMQCLTSFWNQYALQEICMKYFGFLTLNSMTVDCLEAEAEKCGIKKDDQCSYDQLFDILLETSKNSKESVEFQLKNALKTIQSSNDSGEYTFGDFLKSLSKPQEEFCEKRMQMRLEKINPQGIMKCDDIRRMLIEREDSISSDWNGVCKKLNIKNNDLIGFEMFMKVFKEFRC
ncbi:unnamed protein product [Moneuplotes crassus]|uniref:Protein kinase domain-containing protein n=1 Tax=Euplotes crassus TaxID=5936 RepID=A0AAD2D8Y1_EUPCR|nr:unnamed protein product [Moneuplotes crassus]